jgi:hypothetical protein
MLSSTGLLKRIGVPNGPIGFEMAKKSTQNQATASPSSQAIADMSRAR